MFSAITTKPLFWVNPKPLRDGALPVAKNDSMAREIPALLRREETISFSSNNVPGASNFLSIVFAAYDNHKSMRSANITYPVLAHPASLLSQRFQFSHFPARIHKVFVP
uniref:Uncharacterized protein n=1 Tax=Glossina austeni TaxID=7395 RepID=A0A1A9V0Y0_GLOAU